MTAIAGAVKSATHDSILSALSDKGTSNKKTIAAALDIGNMGLNFDISGGDLVNSRSSVATVMQYDGFVVNCLINEIRYDGARRIDRADGQNYNAGVLGIEYVNTESDNTTIISPVPSMFIEPASTNLLLRSSEFENASWLKAGNGAVTSNAVISPDGTLTADKLEIPAGVNRFIYQQINYLNVPHSFSIYLRSVSGSGTYPLNYYDGSHHRQLVNLTEDWQRFEINFTPNAFSGFIYVGDNRLASSLNECYAWGAQVELKQKLTSYIPTASAQVTRFKDDISLPMVLSSNFHQDQGILLFKYIPNYDSDTTENSLFSVFDGSGLLSDSATINTIKTFDSSNTANALVAFTAGDILLLAVVWSASENSLSISISIDSGVNWSSWSDVLYDGAFVTGTDINLFFNASKSSNLLSAVLYTTLFNDDIAETKAWVESNAGTLTS